MVVGGVRRGVLLCLFAFASGACRCPTPQSVFCRKVRFFFFFFFLCGGEWLRNSLLFPCYYMCLAIGCFNRLWLLLLLVEGPRDARIIL